MLFYNKTIAVDIHSTSASIQASVFFDKIQASVFFDKIIAVDIHSTSASIQASVFFEPRDKRTVIGLYAQNVILAMIAFFRRT